MAFKMCKDLSFIRYSAVSASMIRNCLKPEFRKGLAVREEMNVIVNEWAAGKPKLEGGTFNTRD
tara:strand:+ start:2262 stop:2453 length:192 start_codon:yes stop_codon:yes gene_type:complete